MAVLRTPYLLADSKVKIRSPLAKDGQALVEFLLKATCQSDHLTFTPAEKEMFAHEESFLTGLSTSLNALALIAEYQGSIIGSLTFQGGRSPKSAHAGEFGLCVDKFWWGKGIGSALLKTLIDWAKTANIKKINLEVRTDNQRALKLYQKFGFIEEALLKHSLYIKNSYRDILWMGVCFGETQDSSTVRPKEVSRQVSVPEPFFIRELCADDAQAVHDCTIQIARETDFFDMGEEQVNLSMDEGKLVLTKYQGAAKKLYLGAFTASGKLLGVLSFTAGSRFRTEHTGKFSLSARAQYYGHGVKKALLERLITQATIGGIHRLALQVPAEDAQSIALYQQCGFVCEGRVSQTLYYRGTYHDSVIMALLLPRG